MGEKTGIQWCDHTWNPWQGCPRVSPGCDHCYMHREKKRWGKDGDLVVLSKPHTFNAPLRWNRDAEAARVRRRVFANSWSDFFGAESDEWRHNAWAIIRQCTWLDFLVLTKRHGRIAKQLPPDWGGGYPNVWLGVSVENAEWAARRIPALLDVPARVRWVSAEPLLGPVDWRRIEIVKPEPPYGPGAYLDALMGHVAGPDDVLDARIDWIVVGGESGSRRPFDLGWARSTIQQCRETSTKVFIKQLGATPISERREDDPSGDAGWYDPTHFDLRLEDGHGGEPHEWPEDLRVREFPTVHHG